MSYSADGSGSVTLHCHPTTYYTLTLHTIGLVSGDAATVSGQSTQCTDPTCTYSFPIGTVVHVGATGNSEGSIVSAVTGDCDGSGNCGVTMDQDRTVTATFVPGWRISLFADAGPSPIPGVAVPAGLIGIEGFGAECSLGADDSGGAVACDDGELPAGTVVIKAHPAAEHVVSWTSVSGEPCVVTSVDAPNDTCTLQLDQPTRVHVVFGS